MEANHLTAGELGAADTAADVVYIVYLSERSFARFFRRLPSVLLGAWRRSQDFTVSSSPIQTEALAVIFGCSPLSAGYSVME